jgi:hypothetical protein
VFVCGTGKAFGVTDFINPGELNEPVQQVLVIKKTVKIEELTTYGL